MAVRCPNVSRAVQQTCQQNDLNKFTLVPPQLFSITSKNPPLLLATCSAMQVPLFWLFFLWSPFFCLLLISRSFVFLLRWLEYHHADSADDFSLRRGLRVTVLPFVCNNKHRRIIRVPLHVLPRRTPSHCTTLVITPAQSISKSFYQIHFWL